MHMFTNGANQEYKQSGTIYMFLSRVFYKLYFIAVIWALIGIPVSSELSCIPTMNLPC